MDPFETLTIGLFIALILAILAEEYVRKKGINRVAMEVYREWASRTLEIEKENIRKMLEENMKKEYELKLKEWQDQLTEKIREETLKKSQTVLKGKVAEQIYPYFSNFPYDPRDARFLGSPVDLIIFSGLREKGVVEKIVFMEIKTGKGILNDSEKSVRDAVINKKIEYEVVNLEEFRKI